MDTRGETLCKKYTRILIETNTIHTEDPDTILWTKKSARGSLVIPKGIQIRENSLYITLLQSHRIMIGRITGQISLAVWP